MWEFNGMEIINYINGIVDIADVVIFILSFIALISLVKSKNNIIDFLNELSRLSRFIIFLPLAIFDILLAILPFPLNILHIPIRFVVLVLINYGFWKLWTSFNK